MAAMMGSRSISGFASGIHLRPSARCNSRTPPSRRTSIVASAGEEILPLGFDLLGFLASTVVVVPIFKKLGLSPVLAFLFSGVLLQAFGLIKDPKDMEALSELGVLFLLFEMGLELSLDRLKALAKFAFGLGTLQIVICTSIFTCFALPAGQGLGTHILEQLAHASPNLVSIRTIDEAIVIGGALTMSSSAFVLQLLSERNELSTKFGSATLGILLMQDIAVVPLLVLLPLVVSMEGPGGTLGGVAADAVAAVSHPSALLKEIGPTVLKTMAGIGLLLVGGRVLLRRVFEVVAQADNSEAFVGLCLLTVAGASLITQKLGFSDTMGAFIAGILLSESSFKTQVEADIRPFRGLLLGLFFVTTGASIDLDVFRSNWEVILWILAGLIGIKTSVIAALGPTFGLSRSESIRTGFILSQGGEFAFVVLSLAASLHVLPDNLNQVLIIVVVLSMALTPGLATLGQVAGDWVEDAMAPKDENGQPLGLIRTANNGVSVVQRGAQEPIVICGFGPHGQMLAALLDQPLSSLPDPYSRSYIAFDLNPARVQAAQAAGFNVLYGDGTRSVVLEAAGVKKPRALAVCLTSNNVAAIKAVESLRQAYPTTPIYALGAGIRDAAELESAGADRCVMMGAVAGLALGKALLTKLGASNLEVTEAGKDIEEAMSLRASSLMAQIEKPGGAAQEEGRLLQMDHPTQVPHHSATVRPSAFPSPAQAAMPTIRPSAFPSPAEAAIPTPQHSSDNNSSTSSEDEAKLEAYSVPARASADEPSLPFSVFNPSKADKARDKRKPNSSITAVAVAAVDCADDTECIFEEQVALVTVDAQKQVEINAQAREQEAEKATNARR
eukprot:CAMPEP_0119110844 /NCGR_PEP_ID=MMETSP1180-20130426/32455_1 /TAXON_ID=3052 ORGANISM="Chlamydomonas cf sp, Strain CCMP681" /NCGR_SAMPLE_ID=MMETSP1180 /ASSEMBLY_ACC=CAM_ASM_000741 /LENGTH=840 /DNA_ID=CAMNT_0007097455 /DNA_START=229 /DNA_END=2751 /DNA_ORIENTATION=+